MTRLKRSRKLRCTRRWLCSNSRAWRTALHPTRFSRRNRPTGSAFLGALHCSLLFASADVCNCRSSTAYPLLALRFGMLLLQRFGSHATVRLPSTFGAWLSATALVAAEVVRATEDANMSDAESDGAGAGAGDLKISSSDDNKIVLKRSGNGNGNGSSNGSTPSKEKKQPNGAAASSQQQQQQQTLPALAGDPIELLVTCVRENCAQNEVKTAAALCKELERAGKLKEAYNLALFLLTMRPRAPTWLLLVMFPELRIDCCAQRIQLSRNRTR